MSISRADVEPIIDQIVEQFSPRQVVLFGSHAHGHPTSDSDIDVLVIMETEEPPLHAAARISESVDHPVPLDIIVRTPAAFSAQLADRNSFESRIQRDGISLYEATDRGVDTESRGRPNYRSARNEK